MSLILRTSSLANAGDILSVKNDTLTFEEGDGNFMYLLSNMSGSNRIFGPLNQGTGSIASGLFSHAEGAYTTSSGEFSHAEGANASSIGSGSHAEGFSTVAFGIASHAEGVYAVAIGEGSHAEGLYTTASGIGSHAEGAGSIALGNGSHAGGLATVASGSYQTVVGQYNAPNNDVSLFVVGGGINDNYPKDIFDARIDGNGSGSISLPVNTGEPSNPLTGSMYVHISLAKKALRIYTGTIWEDVLTW